MGLTDIKPTIIDVDDNRRMLSKPRSFTFDNPGLVRIMTVNINKHSLTGDQAFQYTSFPHQILVLRFSTLLDRK